MENRLILRVLRGSNNYSGKTRKANSRLTLFIVWSNIICSFSDCILLHDKYDAPKYRSLFAKNCHFFIPEIPLPNEQARMDILKIHSAKITKHGDIGRWSSRVFAKTFRLFRFESTNIGTSRPLSSNN